MRISDWSSDVCSSDLAYRNADIVVSNLKNAHAHMVPHGLDKRKFHWIPNGISMREVGQPQALDENVAHTLPKDGFVVGYAGTLGLANCLGTLIEAAVLLSDKKDIKFVIVGTGRDKTSLRSEEHTSELQSLMRISY